MIVTALGFALLHSLWQVAGAAGCTALALAALSRRSSNLRYAVACLGLVLALVLPVTTCLRALALAPSPVSGWPAAARMAETGAPWRLAAVLPWLVAAWTGGVLLLSLRLLGGCWTVMRLACRRCSAARPEWQRAFYRMRTRMMNGRGVRLLESAAVSVPTAIGWLRPVVLVPAAALAGLTPAQVEAIVAHELAHVRRYDYLVNLVQTFIDTLLFYHPAAWWLSARIRAEREHCCDDAAVAATGDGLGYARALTVLEQRRFREARLVAAATGGPLMKRIERLRTLSGPASRTSGDRATLRLPITAVVFVALAIVVLLSVGVVRAASTPPVDQAKTVPAVQKPAPPAQPEATAQDKPAASVAPESARAQCHLQRDAAHVQRDAERMRRETERVQLNAERLAKEAADRAQEMADQARGIAERALETERQRPQMTGEMPRTLEQNRRAFEQQMRAMREQALEMERRRPQVTEEMQRALERQQWGMAQHAHAMREARVVAEQARQMARTHGELTEQMRRAINEQRRALEQQLRAMRERFRQQDFDEQVPPPPPAPQKPPRAPLPLPAPAAAPDAVPAPPPIPAVPDAPAPPGVPPAPPAPPRSALSTLPPAAPAPPGVPPAPPAPPGFAPSTPPPPPAPPAPPRVRR